MCISKTRAEHRERAEAVQRGQFFIINKIYEKKYPDRLTVSNDIHYFSSYVGTAYLQVLFSELSLQKSIELCLERLLV